MDPYGRVPFLDAGVQVGQGGLIGHGRWVPGGNTYGANSFASSFTSRGFGQAESPLASLDHPSDSHYGTEDLHRVERADRAAMW